MEFFTQWMPVITFFIAASTAAGLLYKWFSADGTAAIKALEEHKKSVWSAHEALERRVQTMEAEYRHLPDREDIHGLKLAMAEMAGTSGRNEEKLIALTKTVENLYSFVQRITGERK
jgi:hypothetical protein